MWSHPNFPKENKLVDDPTIQAIADRIKTEHRKNPSIAWIKEYAESFGITYEDLMQGAENYLSDGDYLSDGGRFEGYSTSEEFWDHFEIVTGKTVLDKSNFFSCSC